MIILDPLKLVGIKVRTSNKEVLSEGSSNKIARTVGRYFGEHLFEKIEARVMPGTTYSVYTEYENDFNGAYTYFIGEAVLDFDNVGEGFSTLNTSSQKYIKFTTDPGPMPDVCINMWKAIWGMSATELGGVRAYKADFEIYDERSLDPQNTALDILIGVES